MSARIKNCGLKTAEAIHEAARTGASYIGLVHHLASPRHLEIQDMTCLSKQAPDSLQQVAVLVNPSDDLLGELLHSFRPHYLQLHRVHNPARIHAIASSTGIPVITGINVTIERDLAALSDLEAVSAHVLLDASDGGAGKPFDWSLIKDLKLAKPWFLAGGLTHENVTEALRATGAPIVDVSSGIEDSPGIKSLEKIAAFNAAVLRSG